MLLNDRVLVELQKVKCRAQRAQGAEQASVFEFTDGEVSQITNNTQKLTDQNDVFGTLVLIPQLPNVKIRIIRWLEHVVSPLLPLLLALG